MKVNELKTDRTSGEFDMMCVRFRCEEGCTEDRRHTQVCYVLR